MPTILLWPSPLQTPRTVNTPRPPVRSPINWNPFGLSSLNAINMTMRVARGVVALIIPAKTDVTRTSAYANKMPGMILRVRATNQSLSQM